MRYNTRMVKYEKTIMQSLLIFSDRKYAYRIIRPVYYVWFLLGLHTSRVKRPRTNRESHWPPAPWIILHICSDALLIEASKFSYSPGPSDRSTLLTISSDARFIEPTFRFPSPSQATRRSTGNIIPSLSICSLLISLWLRLLQKDQDVPNVLWAH